MYFIVIKFHNVAIWKVVQNILDSFLQRYEKHNVVMETLIRFQNVKDIIIKNIIAKDE